MGPDTVRSKLMLWLPPGRVSENSLHSALVTNKWSMKLDSFIHSIAYPLTLSECSFNVLVSATIHLLAGKHVVSV